MKVQLITTAAIALLLLFGSRTHAQYFSDLDGDLPTERFQMQYGEVLIAILSKKEIREELEVLDEQVTEIRGLVKRQRIELDTKVDQNRVDWQASKISDQEFMLANIQVTIDGQSKMEAGLNEILLPHQVKQHRQLFVWAFINHVGHFRRVFEIPFLVDSLEISKSEQSQIIETDNELQKEFEKELEQLQIKYRKKLVKSLGDEKSTKFNELFGEFRKIGLRALKF